MELEQNLKALAKELQIDHFGIADLTPALDFVRKQGGEMLAGYSMGISIGIAMPGAIVDMLPKRDEKAVRSLYRHHAYDILNSRLDLAISRMASLIQASGLKALPVPSSQTLDDEKLLALVSNKLSAHLAGLGWIGKSCLLITPEHGPRVRWATILTDAKVTPTGKPMEQRCGNCRLCVDSCPAHAFTGRAFVDSEPREARYAAQVCKKYFMDMDAQGIKPPVCGLCVYVCPHGRKKASSAN